MSDFINTLVGSKGGGGGGSFKTKPDSLRSNDSFEALIGLGSGRWKGLVNGLKSLKINKVPLEDEDGEANFKDFSVLFADGNPAETQLVNFKLGGGGGTTSVNTVIENTFVTGASSTPNADFIDVRLVISSLYRQDKEGVGPTTMTLEIEMRPSGASEWINPLVENSAPSGYTPGGGALLDDGEGNNYILYMLTEKLTGDYSEYDDPNPGQIVINDKTTSPSVKEIRIAVPNSGAYEDKTWEVRIKMIEDALVQEGEDGEIEERRVVTFESITAVTKQVFGSDPAWKGLVWMQIMGKATDQLNGFPAIEGLYDTLIVKVPPIGVFDPETREYTEMIWDGSYSMSYTNDPAWCIKALIEDGISGISALSPGATLDKWDALEASKYYSELVPDGRGGQHPRFSLNARIDQPQNAEEIVQYLSGAVNSIAVDTGAGRWRLKVDKPENPVALFTVDNIIGEFQYSHTDIDSRYNDMTASFLNEENEYEEDRVRVFDQDNIDIYGRKPTTIVAVGATHRQEVLRRLMFRLRVSLNETRMVKFITNRQGKLYEPLQTILVADQSLGYLPPTGSGALADDDPDNNRTTSRITDISLDRIEITLGRSVRLEPGVQYSISITIPNPDYDPDPVNQPDSDDNTSPTIVWTTNVDELLTDDGDISTLFLEDALPESVQDLAVIALGAPGLPSLPVTYRILEVSPTGGEEVNISALIVDTGKWDAADNVEEDEILGQQTSPYIGPPSNMMFSEKEFITEFMPKRVLTVTWDRPSTLWLDGFKVEYRLNGGNWITLQTLTTDSYVEIQQPELGYYEFRITSLDRRGPISSALIDDYTVEDVMSDNPTYYTYGISDDLPDFPTFEGEKYVAYDNGITYTGLDGIWIATSSLGAPEGTMIAGLAAETLIANIDTLEGAIDGKVTLFYQGATPTAEGEGDLWFDTDIDKWFIWESGAWLLTEDAGIGEAIADAAGAQATADGKVTTFYQDATPTAEGVGDLWTRPSDSPKVLKRWNGTTWDTQANNVTQGTDIGVANGATVNNITRSSSAPSSPVNGDIWVDTSVTPNLVKVRVSGAWQTSSNYVTEGSHIGVANGATVNIITYSSSPPGSPVNGDVWVDTSVAPNIMKVRVSGAWSSGANLVTQGSHIGVANGATANIITRAGSAPGSPVNGDIWVDTSVTPNLVKMRVSGNWEISSNYVTQGSHIGVANGATVNTITYSSSAPGSPGNGDIWVDTSVTPNVVKLRVSGVWQTGANLVTQGSDIGVANGATKNVITRSGSAPVSPVDGDVWVDTSVTPNVIRVRVSAAWQIASNYVTQGTDIGVANGATVNVITYSSSAPGSPVNGDIWVDTSVTPNIFKVRVAGNWQIGSKYYTTLAELDAAAAAAITAATSGLLAVTNDNIMSGSEKADVVLPQVANLGAEYAQLLVRATALGVSASAATTARTNFLTYLAGLSPVYDDTDQNTTLATASLATPALASWTNGGASLGTSGLYTTLTDANAADYSYREITFTTVAANSYTYAIVVKKDAVPAATRQPLFRLGTPSASNFTDIMIDTSTGTFSVPNNTAVGVAAGTCGVFALNDDEWLVWVTRTTAAGETTFKATIFPAVGASGAYNVATTGTTSVRDPIQVLGSVDKTGRDIFKARLRSYTYELNALNGIVAADAFPKHNLPAAQNVYFASNGTAKTDELNRTLIVTRYRGATDVSQQDDCEWSITTAGCTATINNTDASGLKGNITLTAVAADGYIEVVSVRDGITLKDRIPIYRVQDDPAISGGAGATGFDATASGAVTDTSYDGSPQVVCSGTMRSTTGGTVILSGYLEYKCPIATSSRAVRLNARWEKSLAGAGSWNTTGMPASVAGTNATIDPSSERTTGSVSPGGTATGLTASTDYDFRLVCFIDETDPSYSLAASTSPIGTLYGRQS